MARLDTEINDAGATQETSSGLWSSSSGGEVQSEKGKEKGKGTAQEKEALRVGDSKDGLDSEGSRKRRRGEYLGGAKTVAIRNVEAGPFVMEVWVERNEVDAGLVESGYKSASVEDE